MVTRPESDETLILRLLPGRNPDRQDRVRAWNDWQSGCGEASLARYVRAHNNTIEADDDIVQDALITAYLGVESGRYQPQAGVPFTAYVLGIARNKIREARRRSRRWADLPEEQEEYGTPLHGALPRDPEHAIERREQHQQLWSGIASLPVARRQVLEQYLSGSTTEAIAERLEMSEALVRQHKCRGLRALQRQLQPGSLVEGSTGTAG